MKGAHQPGLHPEHPAAMEGCRPVSRGWNLELVTVAKSYAMVWVLGKLSRDFFIDGVRGALEYPRTHFGVEFFSHRSKRF